MAFSFVVETGNADPDANSFASVEFADDYIDANSFAATDWDALDDDAKQRFLVRASRYIDTMVNWNGDRVDQDSGLRWPRAGAYDADGFLIADDIVPLILQEAVCEFASQLVTDDWTQSQATRGFKEIKVDVIDLRMQDGFVRASMPDFVVNMLSTLGAVNRGNRPGFKKVVRT